MARRIEANEHASRGQVRQTPVPARRGASAVVRGHEGFMGRPEAPGVGGSNGQPDDIQQEVEQDDHGREVEDIAVDASCSVSCCLYRSFRVGRTREKVQQGCQSQQHFCAYPLQRTKLDFSGLRGEVDVEDSHFLFISYILVYRSKGHTESM